MAKYFSNTFSKVFQLPTQRNKSFLNLPNLFIVFIKIILPIQNILNVITNETSTTLQQHRRNFYTCILKKVYGRHKKNAVHVKFTSFVHAFIRKLRTSSFMSSYIEFTKKKCLPWSWKSRAKKWLLFWWWWRGSIQNTFETYATTWHSDTWIAKDSFQFIKILMMITQQFLQFLLSNHYSFDSSRYSDPLYCIVHHVHSKYICKEIYILPLKLTISVFIFRTHATSS